MPSEPLDILRHTFGFSDFRPAQADAIGRVMRGEDVVLVMPTGGGKSLCYQIPALARPGVGIVVSPLISLMQDQVVALRQLGVRAAFLNSSLGAAQQRAVLSDLHRGRLDLLYVAPERLLLAGFLDRLADLDVALLAVDEAHCISQWGHDFRPEYRQISQVRRRIPDVPCIAVTATADAPTQREILRELGIAPDGLVVTGFDRPNLCYRVEVATNARKQLLSFVRGYAGEAGIVYCLSRQKVEKTAAFLCENGIPALPYHAGLPARVREENQARFINEEGLVVVATVAFGMGIDKPNVRFVAHLDVPRSPEAYYQETGRAGRDGLPAQAWMLYSLASVVATRKLMDGTGGEGQHKWVERHKFNAIIGFCETARCRRGVLLSYFGQTPPERCGNCDTCLHPVETWDATEAAQKAMSAVHRTGQRFGAAHVIAVLRGDASSRASRFRHDRLPTFGVGADLDVAAWQSVIRQLVAADYLRVDVDGFGGLRLTPQCGPVLKGEERVMLRKDPVPPREKKARRSRGAASAPTPVGKERFEKLRTLRLELAREQGVPPYVIFSDRTLAEMAERRPRSLDDLREVPGVGDVKLARYGDAFLAALRED